MNNQLSKVEYKELDYYEDIIARGLQTFVEVGNALLAIKEKKLYKGGYSDFEVYCQDRWGFAHSQAYRLIEAANVANQLSPIGEGIPANEAQARALVPLPEATRAIAWHTIKATAPDGKITAKHAEVVAGVIQNAIETGALDPGDGVMIPFSQAIHANIIEETYERMKRQEQYIVDAKAKKIANLTPALSVVTESAIDPALLDDSDTQPFFDRVLEVFEAEDAPPASWAVSTVPDAMNTVKGLLYNLRETDGLKDHERIRIVIIIDEEAGV